MQTSTKKTDDWTGKDAPMRNEHAAIAALVRINWDRLSADEQADLAFYAPKPVDKAEGPAAE